MYHVGSKNEKPDRTGFAHFFEHLLFEGSENIKRGEFDDYINNAGGSIFDHQAAGRPRARAQRPTEPLTRRGTTP